MHAGPDSFDEQSKKWKKIAGKRREERRPLPNTNCSITLNPYFMRKEIGIPTSSHDANAGVLLQVPSLGLLFIWL